MDEGDKAASRAGARGLVQGAYPLRPELGQHRGDVVHAVADVVDALASPGQEPPDGAVRIGGGQKLELHPASVVGRHPHSLRGDLLLEDETQAEGVAIEPLGCLEVGHGDADVVHGTEVRQGRSSGVGHAADGTGPADSDRVSLLPADGRKGDSGAADPKWPLGRPRGYPLVMSQLAVGDTAPDFRTADTAGNPIHLDTLLKSGSVILAFYPRAFTPG